MSKHRSEERKLKPFPDRDNTDNLMPIGDIPDYLPVSHRQLTRWSNEGRDNGFPEPAETLGRFKLYDIYEVDRWLTLYRKVTKNMGRGEELNGTRDEG